MSTVLIHYDIILKTIGIYYIIIYTYLLIININHLESSSYFYLYSSYDIYIYRQLLRYNLKLNLIIYALSMSTLKNSCIVI